MNSQVVYILIIGTVVLALLVLFIISFVVLYKERHKQFITEKREMENTFENEKLKLQLDIQEETFKKISDEIHDNIGQMLGLMRLKLFALEPQPAPNQLYEMDTLLVQIMNDVRDLSHTLNADRFKELNLTTAIQKLVDGFKNTNLFEMTFHHQLSEIYFSENVAIILFRIIQELVNNIVKHANATKVFITMGGDGEKFILVLEDNGCGFEVGNLKTIPGTGLKNLGLRAKYISASVAIESQRTVGTKITITI